MTRDRTGEQIDPDAGDPFEHQCDRGWLDYAARRPCARSRPCSPCWRGPAVYRPFLTSITHDRYSGEPIGHDYVPRVDADRARIHLAWAGRFSESWPIPLTPCVLPPEPAAAARPSRRRTRKAA